MKKALLAALVLWAGLHIVYQYTGWEVRDLLPAKPLSLRKLARQEAASFAAPLKIEEKVYAASPLSPDPWVKPFYGQDNTVVFVNWRGKHNAFLREFKNLFKTKEYGRFYNKKIYIIRSNWMSWKYDSSKELILKNCPDNAVCIINPKRKEMAVLPKADVSYLDAFLDKYKNW